MPSILKKFSFREISYKYDDIHFNLDLRYLVDRRFFLYGYDAKNIEILKFPDEVLVKLKSISKDILKEISQTDSITKEIYDSYISFNDAVAPWTKISDKAYLDVK